MCDKLRYFCKCNFTTIIENTNLLEYHNQETKVPCPPLRKFFIAFHIHIPYTQNDMQVQKKNIQSLFEFFSKCTDFDKNNMQ